MHRYAFFSSSFFCTLQYVGDSYVHAYGSTSGATDNSTSQREAASGRAELRLDRCVSI